MFTKILLCVCVIINSVYTTDILPISLNKNIILYTLRFKIVVVILLLIIEINIVAIGYF